MRISTKTVIGTHTGGMSTGFHNDLKYTSGKVADVDETLLYMTFHAKVVAEKVPNMIEILHEIIFNANLNNQEKAIQILKESKANKE